MPYRALEYQLADDYLDRRGPLREEHLGLLTAAMQRGELMMAGAMSDPADRSLFIWSVDDDATVERFVHNDPYVREGIVKAWTIRTWNVSVGPA
jgi:uncharacterized protein YciI